MSTQNCSMQAGQLIVMSSGEYSDYTYLQSYVALQDVSVDQMRNLAEAVNRERAHMAHEGEYVDPQSMFLVELIRKGWVLSIDHHEIHIGSYGQLSLS